MSQVPLSPSEIAEHLAAKTGLMPEQVKAVLQAQAELAYAHAGKGFRVVGIGQLKADGRPARKMVMRFGPDAGKEISIPAARKLKFRLSAIAKNQVLGSGGPIPDLFAQRDPQLTFSAAATPVADADAFVSSLAPLVVPSSKSSLQLLRTADVHLPSGKVIAADPLIGGEGTQPFARAVPPGHHPAYLALTAKDDTVAWAMIRFADKPVARWELAGADDDSGYPVDSGTGSFADPAFHAHVTAAAVEPDEMYDLIVAHMSSSPVVHVATPAGSLLAFTSGRGDGTYHSYFGLDAAGQPVALVTDFLRILPWLNIPKP